MPPKYADYYPDDEDEEAYLRYLEAPGDALGMLVGDGPSMKERLTNMKMRKSDLLHVLDIEKAKVTIEHHGSAPLGSNEPSYGHSRTTIRMPKAKKEKFLAAISKRGGKAPKPGVLSRMTEHGFDTHTEQGERIQKPSLYQRARGLLGKPRSDITAEGHPTKPQLPAARVVRQLGSGKKSITKALPKKDKDDKPTKTPKTSGASKKQAGKGGKTRYTYPSEGGKTVPSAPPAQPVPVPPTPQAPQADPAALANQLGMSLQTLQRIAQRFITNAKLGGRKGFVAFMQSRLKDVADKHKLDVDYFGLVFDALTGSPPPP